MKAQIKLKQERPSITLFAIFAILLISLIPVRGSAISVDSDDGRDMEVESWMTAPFESSFAEADLSVEEWMTAPFETSFAEADLPVEEWMTIPFETADYIEIESWMTAPF